MKNVQLRKATNEDIEIVLQILNTSRHAYLPYAKSPHSLDSIRGWVKKQLIPSGDVVIARHGSEDVGVLATSISDGIGWIDQLYLAPGYVGLGIGSELLKYALSNLPRPVRLWTFQQNEKAIRFYGYHGFKAIEYTDGENNEERCPDILFENT